MNFSSRIRGFFNLHLSNLDQHVLGAPSGHRRPDFRSYGSACCTCSGTCQRLGEGKGRGKLASDKEGSVTCHMGTQFCFRVYLSIKSWVVTTRGRGRGGYRGLGRGTRKRCNRNEEQRQFGVQSSNKSNIQCYHCKKFGHVKADCWNKNQRANFTTENEVSENNGKGENKIFMTNIPSDQKTMEVWFIDSSCSNHMTGLKRVFKELNEGEKLKVELENGKELQVEGKGTVGIETHHGNRILTNVQYVPDIGYNLLSVGQLIESGYSILFDDESKSKTFEKFKHFKAKVKKQSGVFIKSLRSDRGGEFLFNNFNHFCEEHGIHRELTTPYTPEQKRGSREEESNCRGDGKKHVANERPFE
ncbi:copia protein [Cucumis melo var. makuwa]|uniref:Copia protein n=1 Tax=Cucumis melo var. makuwa TaxID=1194695 RepID=A0A5D3BKB8_CUCMM|nr:copia protein [Cucumis melo var. makuwa]